MEQKILIKFRGFSIEAIVSDEKCPKTAHEITARLPFKGKANVWGEEIYFTVPVEAPLESNQTEMEIGDLAFWPAGNAFCIFFGKTPASIGNNPIAASPVNVFGKILQPNQETIEKLRSAIDGEEIVVEKI